MSRLCALAVAFAFAGLGCSNVAKVIEQEGPQGGQLGGGFENPAAGEADSQLDDRLCWEDPRVVSADSAESVSEAHDACMREKGWDSRQP